MICHLLHPVSISNLSMRGGGSSQLTINRRKISHYVTRAVFKQDLLIPPNLLIDDWNWGDNYNWWVFTPQCIVLTKTRKRLNFIRILNSFYNCFKFKALSLRKWHSHEKRCNFFSFKNVRKRYNDVQTFSLFVILRWFFPFFSRDSFRKQTLTAESFFPCV